MAFDYSVRFKAIDKISEKINNINSKMAQMGDKAKQASATISTSMNKSTKNTARLTNNLKKINTQLDSMAEKGKASLGKGIGVLTAGAGMLATIALPLKFATEFNSKMLSVKSIISGGYGTDASEAKRLNDDFIAMTNKAKELGATTEWSASQVAEGMKFMSMAGFNTSQTINAMNGVLSLATVGEMDLARASDIASNALSGFGIDASEMARVSDLMAKTITTSNTTVSMLGESFKVVAPLSAGLGITIEETSAMLGKLGDAGINGSLAGNALKRMMLNLSAPAGEAKKAIEDLGLQTFGADGKFKSMGEQIGQIQGKIKGLSKQRQTEVLKNIFGSEALSSALVLMQQGQKGLKTYTQSLEKAQGTSKRIADIQLSGAGGKLKLLKSAFEGLMISVGSNFTKALGGAYEKITSIFEALTKWTDKNKDLVSMIGTAVVFIGGFVAVMGALYIIFGLVSMSFGVLSTVITVFSTAMKVAQFATLLFNTALWANPITWIVAGVIALIGAFISLVVYFDEVSASVSNVFDEIMKPIQSAIDMVDDFLSKFELFTQAKDAVAGFFGMGDDDSKTTGVPIDNVNKNHTIVDVNVKATGGIATQERATSTAGRVKLNTANNEV